VTIEYTAFRQTFQDAYCFVELRPHETSVFCIFIRQCERKAALPVHLFNHIIKKTYSNYYFNIASKYIFSL